MFMVPQGFLLLPSDPCVLRHQDGRLQILWVDDILAIAPTTSSVNGIRSILEKYLLHDMGDLMEYLGLQITRDCTHGLLFINQVKYAEFVFKKFHPSDCLPASSPTLSTEVLLPSTMESTSEHRFLYQAMIGSLMWLTVWTRPDLAEHTSRLGQFAHNPAPEHHSSVRTVFAYLVGTKELGLCFGGKTC